MVSSRIFKGSIRKFYGGHHDLINIYVPSVLQMTNDMFRLYYRWPMICSVCITDDHRYVPFITVKSRHFIVRYLSSNFIWLKMSYMMGATSEAGTAYPFRSTWVHPSWRWISFCSMLSFLCSVLWIIVCLLVFCPLAIVYYLTFFQWPLWYP